MKSWHILLLTILGLSVAMFCRENDMIGKGLSAIIVICLLVFYFIMSRNDKKKKING